MKIKKNLLYKYCYIKLLKSSNKIVKLKKGLIIISIMKEIYTYLRDNKTLDIVLAEGLKSRARLIEEGLINDRLTTDLDNFRR